MNTKLFTVQETPDGPHYYIECPERFDETGIRNRLEFPKPEETFDDFISRVFQLPTFTIHRAQPNSMTVKYALVVSTL